MNSNDPSTFWLLAIISATSLVAFLGRDVYRSLRYTKQQRLGIEAQRLMLRFCKHSTRANWAEAWDFISENGVMLSELDWPLVQRFTRTAVSVNFSPEAGS